MEIDDITWEMYCEYLGIPVFEPFNKKSKFIFDPYNEKEIRDFYEEYFLCIMDKNHFLNSKFHGYLINKNRLDLINKILNERITQRT
jgi:hypothetical protein